MTSAIDTLTRKLLEAELEETSDGVPSGFRASPLADVEISPFDMAAAASPPRAGMLSSLYDTPYGALTIEDVRGSIPHANRGYERFRAVGSIEHIIVHYDAERRPGTYNPVERWAAQARYHIRKNWGVPGGRYIPGFSLMYHLNIAGNGRVCQTQDLQLITWHAWNVNAAALAVKVDCGEGQHMTQEQTLSLRKLLWVLSKKCPQFPAGRRDVWGHSEVGKGGAGPRGSNVNSTKCPGTILPYAVRFRKGEW